MKKLLLGTIAMAGMLVVPAVSLAATYEYVNTSGTLSTITAGGPDTALLDATNIAVHSGVILVTAPAVTTTTTTVVPPSTTVTSTPVVTTNSNDMSFAGTYMATKNVATTTVATSTQSMPYATTTQATMTLSLNSDMTATLTTSYGNGTQNLVETGSWTSVSAQNGAGNSVQVILTNAGSNIYNPTHVVTYSLSGTTLMPISYNGSYPYSTTTFTKE